MRKNPKRKFGQPNNEFTARNDNNRKEKKRKPKESINAIDAIDAINAINTLCVIAANIIAQFDKSRQGIKRTQNQMLIKYRPKRRVQILNKKNDWSVM